jgi:hypothetical protein
MKEAIREADNEDLNSSIFGACVTDKHVIQAAEKPIVNPDFCGQDTGYGDRFVFIFSGCPGAFFVSVRFMKARRAILGAVSGFRRTGRG